MFFYQILPEQRIPIKLLTYKSEYELAIGQIVEVPIRNKLVLSVVISKNENPEYEEKKLKEVKKVYPFVINQNYINFLYTFAYNTFNSANDALSAILQPIKLIATKYWQNFENSLQNRFSALEQKKLNTDKQIILNYKDIFTKEKTKLSKKEVKTLFYLEKDPSFRIKYIIRTLINDFIEVKNTYQEVLIIFPEKKLLEKIYKEITQSDFENEKSLELNFFKYTASVNKPSRESVLTIIKNLLDNTKERPPYPQPKLNIFFSTKNGLFLPFSNLKKIILIDEANSFYIQDQNSLYYDARDASFLLSKMLNVDLDFVSSFPSVRLYNLYSKSILDNVISNYSKNTQKPPRIKITTRSKNYTFNNLFSEQILEDIEVEYFD